MNLALDPMVPNGEPRAKLWDEARQTAYKDLPLVLQAIREEAREHNPRLVRETFLFGCNSVQPQERSHGGE